jgi:hypothetical protein
VPARSRKPGWLPVLLVLALLVQGCVTRAVNTATSSDVRLYQEHLERPAWLESLSEDEISALVDEALETPVAFYGVVVDEAGEPVADAVVNFALFDQRLAPFEFPYVGWTELPAIETRRDGSFSLEDVTGTALFVRVQKDGYKSVDNSKRYLRYAERLRRPGDQPLPSPEAPERFVLTRGMPLEDYYLVESGGVPIPRDGSEVGYRLDEKDPYGVEPEQGHFALSCDKGPVLPNGRWDWSCRIRMAEGSGIQQRHDLVLQEAPTEGYGPIYEWGFAADDPAWDHRDERYVYLSLADGQYFGHLAFKVRTAGDFYFSVDGMVNRTGSRQLETPYRHQSAR